MTMLPRVRPPRYVPPVAAVPRYNWFEALGRYMVAEVERGRYARGDFLFCQQLAGNPPPPPPSSTTTTAPVRPPFPGLNHS